MAPVTKAVTASDEELTPLELKWVEMYTTIWNGRQAVKEAGYACKSDAKADNIAYSLLRRPRVQEAIKRRVESIKDEGKLKRSQVKEFLRRALFLDPLELFEPMPNGSWAIRNLERVPKWVRMCLTTLKSKSRVTSEGDVESYWEIKWVDKTKLLELAMRYLKMLGDEDTGKGSSLEINIQTVAAMMEQQVPPTRVIGKSEVLKKLEFLPPASV